MGMAEFFGKPELHSIQFYSHIFHASWFHSSAACRKPTVDFVQINNNIRESLRFVLMHFRHHCVYHLVIILIDIENSIGTSISLFLLPRSCNIGYVCWRFRHIYRARFYWPRRCPSVFQRHLHNNRPSGMDNFIPINCFQSVADQLSLGLYRQCIPNSSNGSHSHKSRSIILHRVRFRFQKCSCHIWLSFGHPVGFDVIERCFRRRCSVQPTNVAYRPGIVKYPWHRFSFSFWECSCLICSQPVELVVFLLLSSFRCCEWCSQSIFSNNQRRISTGNYRRRSP